MVVISLFLLVTITTSLGSVGSLIKTRCPFLEDIDNDFIYAAGCVPHIECLNTRNGAVSHYGLRVAFVCDPITGDCSAAPDYEGRIEESVNQLERFGILEKWYNCENCIEYFDCDVTVSVGDYCNYDTVYDTVHRKCSGPVDFKYILNSKSCVTQRDPTYICRDLQDDRQNFDPNSTEVQLDRESLPKTFRICNTNEMKIYVAATIRHKCNNGHYYDTETKNCVSLDLSCV